MGYRVLEGLPAATYGHYAVRPVRNQDIEAIREWRNVQLSILRQKKPIDSEEQLRYYVREVWGYIPSPAPRQMLFVLTYDGSRCAYGGLTNMDWHFGRAELSFLGYPDMGHYAERFRAFLEIVVDQIAFDQLRLHRVWHETYDIPRLAFHRRTLTEFGFRLEGTLRHHVLVEGEYVDSLVYGMVR